MTNHSIRVGSEGSVRFSQLGYGGWIVPFFFPVAAMEFITGMLVGIY